MNFLQNVVINKQQQHRCPLLSTDQDIHMKRPKNPMRYSNRKNSKNKHKTVCKLYAKTKTNVIVVGQNDYIHCFFSFHFHFFSVIIWQIFQK